MGKGSFEKPRKHESRPGQTLRILNQNSQLLTHIRTKIRQGGPQGSALGEANHDPNKGPLLPEILPPLPTTLSPSFSKSGMQRCANGQSTVSSKLKDLCFKKIDKVWITYIVVQKRSHLPTTGKVCIKSTYIYFFSELIRQ